MQNAATFGGIVAVLGGLTLTPWFIGIWAQVPCRYRIGIASVSRRCPLRRVRGQTQHMGRAVRCLSKGLKPHHRRARRVTRLRVGAGATSTRSSAGATVWGMAGKPDPRFTTTP